MTKQVFRVQRLLVTTSKMCRQRHLTRTPVSHYLNRVHDDLIPELVKRPASFEVIHATVDGNSDK